MNTTKTAACSACGSTRAKLDDAGRCTTRMHCHRRRIDRRIAEDDKHNPNGHQCMVAHGSGSIRFCLMREGHKGLHANGGIEWGSREETESGRAFANAFRALHSVARAKREPKVGSTP